MHATHAPIFEQEQAAASDAERTVRKQRKGKVWLYRSLLDAPATIIRDAVLFQLFGYFLLRAAYKPRSFNVWIGRGWKSVSLNAGQLVIGVPKLSEFLQIPQRTIRAKLSVLAKRGIITYQPATHYSIVTLCNWETYQKPKQSDEEASAEVGGEANGEASGVPNTRHTIKVDTLNNGNSKPSRALRFEADDRAFAEDMFGKIRATDPGFKAPDFDRWANDIRLAREQDHRTLTDLRERFAQAHGDQFWRGVILSPSSLRKHFDKLTAKLKGSANGIQQPASPARIRSGEYSDPAIFAKASPGS